MHLSFIVACVCLQKVHDKQERTWSGFSTVPEKFILQNEMSLHVEETPHPVQNSLHWDVSFNLLTGPTDIEKVT